METRLQNFLNVLQPQLILSVLLLVLSLAALLRALNPPQVNLMEVSLELSEDPKKNEQVTLVISDGLRERFVETELPVASTHAERLLDILAGLKARSDWPEALQLPVVYLIREGGQDSAVLDFPAVNVAVSVAQEWALLKSIEATLAAQGIDELRILKEGRADPLFLEHVSAP